jgi:predicted enzyme related to lactoylglutathione lyase
MATVQGVWSGSPCWADLSTSDVDVSRHFYSELFGWATSEPNPALDDYFMFTFNGVPVAGCDGVKDAAHVEDVWTIYMMTQDIERTIRDSRQAGAKIVTPAAPLADLGIRAVL